MDGETPSDPKPATDEHPTDRHVVRSSNGPVTIEQLMEEQGITGPQGSGIFERLGAGWTDADDVILELVD